MPAMNRRSLLAGAAATGALAATAKPAETVLASVRKTGRVLVAYEDHEFMGFGAEVAAQVADRTFEFLDAPVKRVAGAFSPIPYADPLEAVVLPQDDDVLRAAREVLAY